ncbi:electrogenic sodium bicarbonate cotransporter 1 [Plakobranchus ocellatus]|uniref:Anion exchange protein n=1 Tax=Plakobranchus ocellatus TaxID=259542 RepID=A0AAV3ZZ40_9GAST|nr:electrogenic sodium bicarbonate cotransporter 1 [Plakobranchus ocellatus]
MDTNPEHDTKLDQLLVSRVLETGQSHAQNGTVHPMFCQMNRLTETGGSEVVWMQVARWIKFEEVLDEDANRWSKPHVPSLSLDALTTFRKDMRHVPCLLDPDITDFNSLVDKLTLSWVQGGYLDRAYEDAIRLALRKPHRHVHERKLPRPVSGSNLLAVRERGLGGSSVSLHSLESHATDNENDSNEDGSDASSYKATPRTNRKNVKIQRKIPKNAVATNILIGELTTLRRPLMAFVRLNPPRHLGWLCEVRLATQFMFVCLAPDVIEDYDVREIGRCVGAIMVDPIFREVAENSSNRFEILAGISEFCSHLTALPPSVWDPKTRIEPPVKLPKQNYRRVSTKTLKERRESRIEHVDEEEGLRRTGRFFGGVIEDVKRKLPWYASDFKDSLHVQCVASTIFLFLATLTPNVTFGGLLGQGTDQYMGTMECILAAAICGVIFALFAGQPLNILGSTGPMLVLEMIIYEFCRDNSWDFLPFRVWVGLWTALILLLVAAFDLSALVRFITRFTEECFACLIAIIFIYEAFAKTIKINSDYRTYFGSYNHTPSCPASPATFPEDADSSGSNSNSSSLYLPLNTTAASLLSNIYDNINNTIITNSSTANSSIFNTTAATTTTMSSTASLTGTNSSEAGSACKEYVPDVFLLSFIEFLFTFVIAFTLVKARNSIFFPNVVRRMMCDFGVLIAIVIVVGVDAALEIDTPKLEVPEKFTPTRPDRPWLINPFSDKNPWWLALAGVLPALLATILIFMDQQITAVIVNRKEHKLKKGSGYHLDILVLAVLIVCMSFLGLPWYVAATVSALAHIMSLKVESDCAAPGEKPEFLGVREQRVTALLVGILSGLSILLTGILKIIPLPVLYGVFLFMGIRSLDGMQLVDRFLLYIVSPKYQPDYPYLRHVQLMRVHLYTLIQIMCLAGLWIVKSLKATSIGFPLMVLATCFIRKLLDCLFSQEELTWLDHLLPPLHSSAKFGGGGSHKKNTEVTFDQVITMETKRRFSLFRKPVVRLPSPFPRGERTLMETKMRRTVEARMQDCTLP